MDKCVLICTHTMEASCLHLLRGEKIMMAELTYIVFMIIIVILLIAFLGYSRKASSLSYNWPLVGMLLALVPQFRWFFDKNVEILASNGGTFHISSKNYWFLNMDTLLTSNPSNVHHIMSANFSGYPKGVEWRKRFDIFGDSLFNFDFGKWKYHRTLLRGFLNHQRLLEQMPKMFEDSMEKQLIPSLEHVCKQDVPETLQHLLESIWKLQKRLRIGKERRLSKAWTSLDNLISDYMSIKRKELSSKLRKEEMSFSALELILIKDELAGQLSVASDKVIRDNLVSFMLAAHDTSITALSWFFWLLSKHPAVEKRIREEIQQYLPENRELKWLAFGAKELNKMVYLHAALCETLRLYPPVPFQSRSPIQNDTLPSGHKVNERTRIVICTYAMGRMSSIWGEDCHEFTPERWITDNGVIKHEAAHKFFAFNAGPRICPGKDMAFTLMKATASAIIHNYDVQVVENQRVSPKLSILLHMSQGLMVKVKKRWG